jgi:hypothetical protein
MHLSAVFLSTIAATAIAGPIQSRKQPWNPVDNTTTTCDSLGSQYIPVDADATDSLVEEVCKKFMPCADPTREICAQVMDPTLNGTQSVMMNDAAVMTKDEASFQDAGWVAQCEFLEMLSDCSFADVRQSRWCPWRKARPQLTQTALPSSTASS